MKKYTYITIKVGLSGKLKEDHHDLIEKQAKKGYRFVTAIPLMFSQVGPKEYEFVFEKE